MRRCGGVEASLHKGAWLSGLFSRSECSTKYKEGHEPSSLIGTI